MNASCLEHRLTDAERQTFNETGWLQLDNVLQPDHIAQLTGASDTIYERALAGGQNPQTSMFYPNFIPENPLFADLVDYEEILPKVWGMLGWNMYLYHAHLIVTPPTGQTRSAPGEVKTFGWHQDSGRVNQEMESHPRPRLSLKVAYFLSDTGEEGRGNFWVIPGSHLRDDLQTPEGGIGQPEGAIPVLAKPGSVVFFDRRLWHTASPNWSDVTRKILFYGYGYRWIRTKDDMTVSDLWPDSDPIRKQMLGYGLNCNGFYSPSDDDVPLRGWLKQHSPEEAK